MKTFKFYTLILLSVLFLGLYSCSEDDSFSSESSNLISESSDLDYPVLDNEGRLLFDDMSHFENFMLAIEELPLDEIQKLNEKNEFMSS